MGSTDPGKVAARLCEAELAVNGQAHFGRVRILLAVILPPADRAKTHGIGRFQGLISATWAPISDIVAFHIRIDEDRRDEITIRNPSLSFLLPVKNDLCYALPDEAAMEKCRICGTALAVGIAQCPQCGKAFENDPSEYPAAEAPQMFAPPSDLNGIGGWLILIAVGLGIAPFVSLLGVYRDFRLLFGDHYGALESYRGLALLILIEGATNMIFFLALIGLNGLFYRKKKSFPGWMITFLCVQLFIVLIDHFAALRYFPAASLAPVARASIGAAIWVPYFMRSLRVKDTFIC